MFVLYLGRFATIDCVALLLLDDLSLQTSTSALLESENPYLASNATLAPALAGLKCLCRALIS